MYSDSTWFITNADHDLSTMHEWASSKLNIIEHIHFIIYVEDDGHVVKLVNKGLDSKLIPSSLPYMSCMLSVDQHVDFLWQSHAQVGSTDADRSDLYC